MRHSTVALPAVATVLLLASTALPALANPPAPNSGQAFTYHRQGVELTFVSHDPGFDPQERERLVDTFFAVYPQEVAMFNPQAPKAVRISVEADDKGLAATAGDTIHLNGHWFTDHPQAVDVITHEAMHVVQQYHKGGPGWITEGLADWARFRFGVNKGTDRFVLPEYNPKQHYNDSYRVTARFLVWCNRHVKPRLVVALDHVMRAGSYSPAFWVSETGKSVDELWAEYGCNPTL